MDDRPLSLCSGSPPLIWLNPAARRPSPLHSGAPPLLQLDPMVRRPSPLCSSAPSLLRLSPTDCHPSSLCSGLILQPTVPHCFAQALSLFSGSGYMKVLIRGGQYFLEDVMREREPYLHHLFLERFQDPLGRAMSWPGERWSKMLIRRCEEAMLVEKIQGEQQRLGVARRDWVGGGEVKEEDEEKEEEEEEEEEEHKEEKQDEKPTVPRCFALASPSSPARSHGLPSVTALLRCSPSSLYHNQRWGL